MKVEIRASLSAVAAAVTLVACASKGPAGPEPGAQDDTSAEYQRIAENATQTRVCKRQAVLGTRVDSIVCLTPAEMKAQQEHADDVMQDIRTHGPMNRQDRPPTPPPTMPPKQ